jgi:hypothetical protein
MGFALLTSWEIALIGSELMAPASTKFRLRFDAAS